MEEADHKILVNILEKRLQAEVKQWLELSNDAITEAEIRQSCRDTAHVLIILLQQELAESINQEIATQVLTITAKPLPDAMIFPAGYTAFPIAQEYLWLLSALQRRYGKS